MTRLTHRLAAATAGALALLIVGSAFDTADARRSGGFHGFHGGHARAFSGRAFSGPRFHAGRSFHHHRFVGRPFHGHRHARFHGRRLLYGIPLAATGYYAYSDSCYWLRRRALNTGSGYWWDRYYGCVNGYY